MDEYERWADRLIKALVIQSDEWMLAIAGEWRRSLMGSGFAVPDLHVALDHYLIEDSERQKGYDPVPAVTLLRSIRRLAASARQGRLARASRNQEQQSNFGVCEACRNVGLVVVPHPQFVKDGEWIPRSFNHAGEPSFATTAVICSCWIGSQKETRQNPDHPITTLRNYELRFNSAWREHVSEREEATRVMIAADDKARGLPDIRRTLNTVGKI